ncbi:bifunctional methylenetetrahydrofolate dehydrogenase/methenyltetrahydrofolate cyclohydrolase FolD [Sphingobium sp. B2]|uniref:bifunctional methylenetetrahydrofolate dehydrogenase/methenyltetrahydrofolate cyclohydrolase FolD n=1 Tax=Sphingobium sp. B2 TaxID=2583228 RepID=UPI0011A25BAE|nr:bifunctional methylenetetrahydrofolate dehydrogenase/methenyltetrahydrofolate cyclohydrolase FolD [Sphingobium sp. B2]
MVEIISGTAMAATITDSLREEVSLFAGEHGYPPTLAVVLVGDDPASQIYVRRKIGQCAKIGLRSIEHRFSRDLSEADLLGLIARLNEDPEVHGILVQLPLPAHIDSHMILDAINPLKDVDGFHPVNVGRLSIGNRGLLPCTPMGCMMLLESLVVDFRGKKAVVIGKSNIVGKPVALLLLERECTVTVTHRYTENLPEIVRTADILVVAAGSPGLVRGDWVKPGAIVIDVGINRTIDGDGRPKIVGDVAFEEMDHAGAVTPVPGGVGPMTIACLLVNTVKAATTLNSHCEPISLVDG